MIKYKSLSDIPAREPEVGSRRLPDFWYHMESETVADVCVFKVLNEIRMCDVNTPDPILRSCMGKLKGWVEMMDLAAAIKSQQEEQKDLAGLEEEL